MSNLLEEYCKTVEVAAVCCSAAEAEQAIRQHKPDVIFLDIEMPGENGLRFIERIGHPDFEVVFATAYNQHALRAFQLSALDYITKPITATQVTMTVQRAIERIGQKRAAERFAVMQELLTGKPRRMIVHTGKAEEIVYFDQLVCLEAEGRYTFFYLNNGTKLMSSSNLGEYMDALAPYGFIRAHNSWAVNDAHILRYHVGDNVLEMDNKIRVPIGRVYKEEVLKQMRGG